MSRLPSPEPGPAPNEINSRPPWRTIRRRARVIPEAVSANVITLARVSLAGGDTSVDTLTTQLVISWCVTHGTQL